MEKDITVRFRGSNNTLFLHKKAFLRALNAQFDCDNGTIEIGSNTGVIPLKTFIRIGQDSTVKIGNNVSNNSMVSIPPLMSSQERNQSG